MPENTRKMTQAEYESRIEKIQVELLTAQPERTPRLLRAFALWLNGEKYLNQESASRLLCAAKSAGMAEIEAIQIIRDASGCIAEDSSAVTISRGTYATLVDAYDTLQLLRNGLGAIGDTPVLELAQLEELAQK